MDWESKLWEATLWEARESRATDFGSGPELTGFYWESNFERLHFGRPENLGQPILDLGKHLPFHSGFWWSTLWGSRESPVVDLGKHLPFHSGLWESTLWGSALWESRESRATDLGSGHTLTIPLLTLGVYTLGV